MNIAPSSTLAIRSRRPVALIPGSVTTRTFFREVDFIRHFQTPASGNDTRTVLKGGNTGTSQSLSFFKILL